MASVYHEQAMVLLKEWSEAPGGTAPPDLVAAIDAKFPGWGNNAVPTYGYSTPHHHLSIVVSRALHDAMPASGARYNYEVQHGFAAVMMYLEHPQRTKDDTAALLKAARAGLQRTIDG